MGAGLVERSTGPFGPILKEAHSCLFGRLFSSRAIPESVVGALGLEQVELTDEDFNIGGSFPGYSALTDKALMDEASRYEIPILTCYLLPFSSGHALSLFYPIFNYFHDFQQA